MGRYFAWVTVEYKEGKVVRRYVAYKLLECTLPAAMYCQAQCLKAWSQARSAGPEAAATARLTAGMMDMRLMDEGKRRECMGKCNVLSNNDLHEEPATPRS